MLRSILVSVFAGAMSLAVPARAGTFGNWMVGSSSDGASLYAATINDSGNILGQYCSTDNAECIWLIAMTTGCEQGNKYPVLANSDSAASHLEVYCSGKLDGGLYKYAFTNFDLIDDLVRKGSKIGIAIPLQRDQFIVVRFDLAGSMQALTQMRAAVSEKAKPVSRGTRDQRL